MSITCSIPGCNRRTSLSDETKLYRVPAVAIGPSESSGLIYNLTNERRKKWFEVLEICGLNEDNATSFRVCSNHFKDGKPSPMFDSKSKDWVPSINLPFSENVIEQEIIEEFDNNKDKRRRGRTGKRDTKIRSASERRSPVRSKSVGRSKLDRNTNSFGRSKSVCRSKFFENALEENNSDQPFVFVDIHKIKEGTPIPFRDPTPRPRSPKEKKISTKIKTNSLASRSFGTQTNPNVLPPLNWGRSRTKKQQDPRYRTKGIQTEPVSMLELSVSDNSTFQACLGEMIEFVRMQILDYNLKALGNGFKIKECALHFQKEGDVVNPKDKEANTVVVHPTRLLSSNWQLLEAVAMSLDLYRLQDKNIKSCFSRTVNGKTEIIEKISDNFVGNECWRNPIKEIDKNSENLMAEIVMNDDENGNQTRTESPIYSTEKDAVISPVLPRITSVISIGELLKDSSSAKSPAKQSAARKKLATVSLPSPESTPNVTRLTPRNSSVGRKKTGASLTSTKSYSRAKKKIPFIANKRRSRIERNPAIQGILGTSKVPRVVLSKLPESVFENGGRVPLATAFRYSKAHRTPSPNKGRAKLHDVNKSPQILWVGNESSPAKGSLANDVKNTSILLKPVKNIPLKLPQTSGVAGYLLVPNASTVGSTTPLMYVPKPDAENIDPKTDFVNQNNFEEVMPDSNLANCPDDATSTLSEPLQGDVAPTARVAHAPKIIKIRDPKITKMTEPKITKLVNPKLPRKRGPNKKPKTPRRGKKVYDWEANAESVPDDGSSKVETFSNGGEALLRCPYCLKNCKDGLDFINHRKTTGCKGKKNAVSIQATKGKKRTGADRFHDCNVCGNVFVEESQLDIHLLTHVEYEVWNEKCTDCPKKFATREELEDHILDRHSWKVKIAKFECKDCEKRFTTRKRLECHIEKKHPPIAKKRCNIRIRCKFCREIFELEHYRQVHWRECQEKKKDQENKEMNDNSLGGKPKVNDNVKITKANRESIKVKVTRRNTEDGKLMRNRVQIENAEIPEDTPKKPTAIRTMKKEFFNDDLEAQLSRMFHEDTSEDSSEYEQEELLNEGYEDVITTGKSELNASKEESQKGIKRLMNLNDSETEEDFQLPMAKMSKVDSEEMTKEEDELLNNNLTKESAITNTKKIDIKSLLSVDDSTNDIVIEEIEDDQYFSMDESTH